MTRTTSPKKRPSPAKPAKLEVLRAENLSSLPWLVHGFSTRNGGVSQAYGRSLNLGITKHDTHENVARNRELFEQAIGASSGGQLWPIVSLNQVHSPVIYRVDEVSAHHLSGDGLITNVPGLLLTVKTADCVPVVLVDPKQCAVGVFHAGWRGTLARIVEKGVGELRRNYHSDPADVLAAIGPCIQACCYEVSDELEENFEAQFSYGKELFKEVFDYESLHLKYPMLFLNQRAPGHGDPASKLHLDLIEANRRQLRDAGVPAENIWASDLCTSCHTDRLFSHRKEAGVTGRMMAAVGVR